MWNEVIRTVNLDGMYRCVKCNKDLEYGVEGVDFEFENGYSNKVCTDCMADTSFIKPVYENNKKEGILYWMVNLMKRR